MDFTISPKALYIINSLEAHGFEAYVVGGCVRDILCGNEPKDWDICTSALPEETSKVFLKHQIIETGLKHGTITVIIDKESFEVTTFRIDGQYKDSRRPDSVSFTRSLKEDLSRRDFTVNAMAYSPKTGLIATHGGEDDLRRRIIRCVGNAKERFDEDPLRILRALRFSSTQDMSIEEETAKAIDDMRMRLLNVSMERICIEFEKILMGRNAKWVLSKFRDVFAVFIPEIKPCFDFKQNNPYHIYDVWSHTVESISEATQDRIVRLTMFFHDIGKPSCYTEDEQGIGHFYGHDKASEAATQPIMERLKFDKSTTNKVVSLVKHHDRVMEASPRSMRRALNLLGEESLFRLFEVMTADTLAQSPYYTHQKLDIIANLRLTAKEVLQEEHCFSLKDLAVNGNDLIELGYSPGPQIGAKLNELLDKVLDFPELNEKQSLLKLC